MAIFYCSSFWQLTKQAILNTEIWIQVTVIIMKLTNYNKLASALIYCNLLCATTLVASTFVSIPAQRHHHQQQHVYRWSISQPAKENGFVDDSYSSAEVKAMEQLIVSISKEPTDESRRHRLQAVFDEELSTRHSERFSALFGEVLIVVGDRVKQEANEAAWERRRQQEADLLQEKVDGNPDDDSSKDEGVSGFIVGNTEEEHQLWALIDMMVQSKTIVKRAAKELGSEGKFG